MAAEKLKETSVSSKMESPYSTESRELLLAIARRGAHDGNQQVARLAGSIHDWDLLLDLAREHRMAPMLYSRLKEAGAAIPPSVQERLGATHDWSVFHHLANSAELIEVLQAFDREGIPAMPFKGIVLAASIYPDPADRPAGDMDLILHQRHLARATAILLARGYELTRPVRVEGTPEPADSYEYHFERAADGRVLELCWRLDLFQRRFRRNLGLEWVWPGHRTTRLAGAEVPDMRPEIKLLVLCLHGCKHIWSRLIWVCDIAQLLASSPDLDWTSVVHEADRSGLWRPLAFGVLLGHDLAGASVPNAILRRFESDKIARGLARHIQENIFKATGSVPAGRVPYHIQLLSARDRMRLLLSMNPLQPNERDEAFFPLPRSLHAAYYLVRPLRILRDKSAR